MSESTPANIQSLPIFPLNTVLFPHGKMNLRIFEARYMDMVARCMQANETFGVCLIAEGQEVGVAAVPHKVGTEARIVDWDMSQPGLLGLTIRGGRRFRVLEQVSDEQQLVTAVVRWFDEEPACEIPPALLPLQPLLQLIINDAGEARIPQPHALGDANWAGYRYAEVLPIPATARQALLELEDPVLRLTIIQQYLIDHKLLKQQD